MSAMKHAVARRRCALVLAVVLIILIAPVAAQRDLQPYRDPYERFSLQHPKSWQALFGVGATLLTLFEKSGKASIQVEYFRLNQPLDAERDYDLIVQIESDLIRERQPKSDQLKAWPMRADMPAVVIVEFTRPGLRGAERIRQFSLVKNADLFRIMCVSSVAEFARFAPVFEQVARSFAIATKRSE